MKISAIIPTVNRVGLITRAIESVVNQTHAVNEIIVVDDGSTDDTVKIIADQFPFVKIYSQENRGVSAARNRGIAAATGEWVAFLDSDDQWLPEKVEQQVKALKNNPDSLFCYTNEIWFRHGRRVNPKRKHQKYGGFVFEECLQSCFIGASTVLLHRSLFDTVGLFDESLPACEDYDYWLRVAQKYPVLYLDEPLIIKYAGHGDQLSYQYWGMDRFRIDAIYKLLRTGNLTSRQRQLALETMAEKITLFTQGAKKREKYDQAAYYDNLLASMQGA